MLQVYTAFLTSKGTTSFPKSWLAYVLGLLQLPHDHTRSNSPKSWQLCEEPSSVSAFFPTPTYI